MRDINKIIIHCSATPPDMDIGVEEIRGWHLAKGWSDVGYHFVIRRDGTVEEGRGIAVPGAHAKGANKDSIGICLVGGVRRLGDGTLEPDFNFNWDQMFALDDLVATLTETYDAEVMGHRDVPNAHKACPCFDVKAWYS